MATSALAIRNAIATNESKHLVLNPLQTQMLSKPLPESAGCVAERFANQFYSLSPIVETGNEFGSWNYSAANDIKLV